MRTKVEAARFTAMERPKWSHLLVCPDCRDELVGADSRSLDCPRCERNYPRTNGGYRLLPSGVEPSIPHHEQRRFVHGNSIARWLLPIYSSAGRSQEFADLRSSIMADLPEREWALNIGSRDPSNDRRLLNLDVCASEYVSLVGVAERIPLRDESVALAISQEVFEHLPNPWIAARQVARILKPGGVFLIAVPFIIGYHPAPNDYWRFTHEGLRTMLEDVGLVVSSVRASSGAGTAMYRMAVESSATMGALISSRLYLPAKAAAAICYFPFRWIDRLTANHGPTNRIAAGFYAVARKPGSSVRWKGGQPPVMDRPRLIK